MFGAGRALGHFDHVTFAYARDRHVGDELLNDVVLKIDTRALPVLLRAGVVLTLEVSLVWLGCICAIPDSGHKVRNRYISTLDALLSNGVSCFFSRRLFFS